MKKIFLILAVGASRVAAILAIIWGVVEFVLYLINADPFNFWSVALLIFSGICYFLFAFFVILEASREMDEELERRRQEQKNQPPGMRRSKFQERLEAMQRSRNEQIRKN